MVVALHWDSGSPFPVSSHEVWRVRAGGCPALGSGTWTQAQCGGCQVRLRYVFQILFTHAKLQTGKCSLVPSTNDRTAPMFHFYSLRFCIYISLVNDPSIHLFVFLSSWFYFVCVSSFHTGWHSESTSIYDCAVRLARDIFDLAVLVIPLLFPHTPNDVPTLTGEYLCKTAISISILASCTIDILSQDFSWISNGWSSMPGFSSVALFGAKYQMTRSRETLGRYRGSRVAVQETCKMPASFDQIQCLLMWAITSFLAGNWKWFNRDRWPIALPLEKTGWHCKSSSKSNS